MRGRRWACAAPTSALAASTARVEAYRSGRWASTSAGTSLTASWAGCGRRACAEPRRARSAVSSVPVSATRPLSSSSHCAAWATSWARAWDALARASASLAGGWKPALALSSVRRAVSMREAASVWVCTFCASQARRAR